MPKTTQHTATEYSGGEQREHARAAAERHGLTAQRWHTGRRGRLVVVCTDSRGGTVVVRCGR